MMIKRFLLFIVIFLSLTSTGFAHEVHKHKPKPKSKKHYHHKKVIHKKPLPVLKAKHEIIKPEIIKREEAPPKHHYQFHNPHLIKRSIVFAQSTKTELVDWVHRAVASVRYTRYRFGGTYFNMTRGIYEVDCSGYVDKLLDLAVPRAYASLVNSTHTEKPTSQDYYTFFKNLPEDTSNNNWQKVDDVDQLKAGDIIVFRYNDANDTPGGHVMIVMGSPSQDGNDPNAYEIKVSDSASARHSDDTRSPRTSGVGIGTLMLKQNPNTHEPDAYAWTVDSGWKRIDAAMAEPIGAKTETDA